MTGQRIALVAMTTSGAAGDYVGALARAMGRMATVGLWAPQRPELSVPTAEVHALSKPESRVAVAFSEAKAWFVSGSIAPAIRAWRPDATHVVFGEGYPSAARTCADLSRFGCTTAATWHDVVPHGQAFDRVQHNVAQRTIHAASGVHVHCDELSPANLRTPILVAEHPAPECEQCAGQTTTRPLRVEGPIVVVGRFAPYKGTDVLCDALERYWTDGGQRPLRALGQGRVPSSLRRLESRWRERVTIDNRYVSPAELHRLLTDAAVCVMPYTTGTQSGLPWLARLHGAHLIATDVGCIGSVARRIGARVVPAGSVEALVDALAAPPSAWTDIARVPLPTYDALATRLLDWYPTLSGA
jgi:glycosyltransferase involved in cell wall biosynthesis